MATDVIFDFILAREWSAYSNRSLKGFTRTFYFQMLQRYYMLPIEVRNFLPFMIQNNRLYSYSTEEGIKKALESMGNHTAMKGNPALALNLVKENYETFSHGLKELIAELTHMAKKEFGISVSMTHTAKHQNAKE